jgi:hypothetical protein
MQKQQSALPQKPPLRIMKKESEFKIGDKVWFFENKTLFWSGYRNRAISGRIEIIDFRSDKIGASYKLEPSGNTLHTVISLKSVAKTRKELYETKRAREDFRVGDLIFGVSQADLCLWTILKTETCMGPIVKVAHDFVTIQLMTGTTNLLKDSCLLVSRMEDSQN